MHIPLRKPKAAQQDLLPDRVEVIPFGRFGAGVWTGHPIGLVIVVGVLAMGILGLPEARWFLALAAPAGAIFGFFIWLHNRNGLANRRSKSLLFR